MPLPLFPSPMDCSAFWWRSLLAGWLFSSLVLLPFQQHRSPANSCSACTPTAGDDDFQLGRAPAVVRVGGQVDGTSTATSPNTVSTDTPDSTVTPTSPPISGGCGQCEAQLPVRRVATNSRAITQSGGINPTNSCSTLSIICTGNNQDSAVIFTYFDPSGADVGSTFGSGQVAARLDCTPAGQWAIGNASNVVELECISS